MLVILSEQPYFGNLPIFYVYPAHDTVTGHCSCEKPTCEPTKSGKHPRFTGFKSAATNDPLQIAQWGAEFPHCNWGGVIREGFCVLDIDVRHKGDEALRVLIEKHGPLPDTVAVETASGGAHYYFKLPSGLVPNKQNVHVDGHGVELLCAGHPVVLPPSVIFGKAYHFTEGHSPDDVAIAELPAWLLSHVDTGHSRDSTGQSAKAGPLRQYTVPSVIPRGTRNTTLVSIAGSLLNRHVRDDALLTELLSINGTHCRPPLGSAEVEKIAASMQAKHDGGVDTEKEAEIAQWKERNRSVLLTMLEVALTATQWKGRTGPSTLSALLGCIALADELGSLVVEASYRELAEICCMTRDGVYKAVRRLIDEGWLTIECSYRRRFAIAQEKGASAEELAKLTTVFRLHLPEGHKKDILLFPPILSFLRTFLRTLVDTNIARRGGVGLDVLRMVWVLLETPHVTPVQLAKRAGMNITTVRRKLKKLQTVAWVSEDERGGGFLVDTLHIDVDAAAEELGVAGRAEKMRELHKKERRFYREEWLGIKDLEKEKAECQKDWTPYTLTLPPPEREKPEEKGNSEWSVCVIGNPTLSREEIMAMARDVTTEGPEKPESESVTTSPAIPTPAAPEGPTSDKGHAVGFLDEGSPVPGASSESDTDDDYDFDRNSPFAIEIGMVMQVFPGAFVVSEQSSLSP